MNPYFAAYLRATGDVRQGRPRNAAFMAWIQCQGADFDRAHGYNRNQRGFHAKAFGRWLEGRYPVRGQLQLFMEAA